MFSRNYMSCGMYVCLAPLSAILLLYHACRYTSRKKNTILQQVSDKLCNIIFYLVSLTICWNYTRNCNLHVHQIQQPCEHRPFRTEWNVLFLQSESDWSLHPISSKLWDVSWKKSSIPNYKGYNIMDDQGSGMGYRWLTSHIIPGEKNAEPP